MLGDTAEHHRTVGSVPGEVGVRVAVRPCHGVDPLPSGSTLRAWPGGYARRLLKSRTSAGRPTAGHCKSEHRRPQNSEARRLRGRNVETVTYGQRVVKLHAV